jgi:hypothetical protein
MAQRINVAPLIEELVFHNLYVIVEAVFKLKYGIEGVTH